MSNWLIDKAQIDVARPELNRWLAQHVIADASEREDKFLNIDLRVRERNIAIRGRWRFSQRDAWDYFAFYWSQFTLRSARPSTGHLTELDKILAGLGEWFYYYWVDNRTKAIISTTLIDLNLLRPHLRASGSRGLPYEEKEDRYATGGVDARFRAYSIEVAAARGCVLDHSYADGFKPTWAQRQIAAAVRGCAAKRVAPPEPFKSSPLSLNPITI